MGAKNASIFTIPDWKTCISTLPALPGAYAVQLHLNTPRRIQVGKFSQVEFPAGHYLYLGSALGPGGLRARLSRHIGGTGKPHWHIDYLRGVAEVYAISYVLASSAAGGLPLECTWSQMLTRLPRGYIPLAGFGASDCRSGCQAHLVGFPTSDIDIIQTLQTSLNLEMVTFQIIPGLTSDVQKNASL